MTVSKDYENVNNVFKNVLANSKEGKSIMTVSKDWITDARGGTPTTHGPFTPPALFVKDVSPFMVAVSDRIIKCWSEYSGKPLTLEVKNKMVERFQEVLREIFLGQEHRVYIDPTMIKEKPSKPIKAPISIPRGIHASWHSIVENGERDD